MMTVVFMCRRCCVIREVIAMQGSVVRISEIEIRDFKNVKHGLLKLDNPKKTINPVYLACMVRMDPERPL